jgi:hypothetical protein
MGAVGGRTAGHPDAVDRTAGRTAAVEASAASGGRAEAVSSNAAAAAGVGDGHAGRYRADEVGAPASTGAGPTLPSEPAASPGRFEPARLFAWAPNRGATYYHFVLRRDGERVYEPSHGSHA